MRTRRGRRNGSWAGIPRTAPADLPPSTPRREGDLRRGLARLARPERLSLLVFHVHSSLFAAPDLLFLLLAKHPHAGSLFDMRSEVKSTPASKQRASTRQLARRFEVIVDQERCKGCELCIATCPREVLGMSASLNRRGVHFAQIRAQDRCTGCQRCALICPDTAIEIAEDTE